MPLGESFVSGLANFSVRINILGVRGHMASVSTLVGVQKVHREPVSGRPWVFSEERGREFSLCTMVSQLALCFPDTLNQDSKM